MTIIRKLNCSNAMIKSAAQDEQTDRAQTCTSWGPASFRKVALVWAAQARASRVFPVPGGPYNNTPLGGRMPSALKRSFKHPRHRIRGMLCLILKHQSEKNICLMP